MKKIFSSIEGELEVSKIETEKEIERVPAVSDVKLLMNSTTAEDMKILRGLGNQHQMIAAEAAYGKHLELKKLDSEYGGRVYTISQIQDIAIKYRLRFLNTSHFTGKLDINAIGKIKDFAKKTNSPIDEITLERRFYILAAPHDFSENTVKFSSIDPAIFYQIDGTHYRLIHKWGSDLGILRMLKGFKWKSYWNWVTVKTITTMFFTTMFLWLVNPTTFQIQYPIIFAFLSLLISFVLTIVNSVFCFSENDKIQKNFFTEHNWRSTDRL